jgi:hypothetical protein
VEDFWFLLGLELDHGDGGPEDGCSGVLSGRSRIQDRSWIFARNRYSRIFFRNSLFFVRTTWVSAKNFRTGSLDFFFVGLTFSFLGVFDLKLSTTDILATQKSTGSEYTVDFMNVNTGVVVPQFTVTVSKYKRRMRVSELREEGRGRGGREEGGRRRREEGAGTRDTVDIMNVNTGEGGRRREIRS